MFSKSVTGLSIKLLWRITFNRVKSINGDISSLLVFNVSSRPNDLVLPSKLNSFTSDAIILGVSSSLFLLRATFTNPSSLNDASDPFILEPDVVLTLPLRVAPVGIIEVTCGFTISNGIFWDIFKFFPPPLLVDLNDLLVSAIFIK